MQPSVSELRSKLKVLSRNFWWTWMPDILQIFQDLEPGFWEQSNHNPMALLDGLPQERWTELERDPALQARVDRATRLLETYLRSASTWTEVNAGALLARPVVYLCAEFGLHESIPIYSGGMGVLAGDFLKSASDIGLPVVGVGLFYREGYFRQVVDREGLQGVQYSRNDPTQMALELAHDPDGKPVLVRVETSDGVLAARVWSAPVGRCRLLLLDADVQENGPEARALSRRLYSGDQDLRIEQEILLGIGGVRALQQLGIRPGVLHLNEGHCAFGLLELARIFMEDGCDFPMAFREAAARTVFTTHTPIPAGHDWFPPDLVDRKLSTFRESIGLEREAFLDLGRVHRQQPHEPFCMSVLALRAARRINAVSALNGRVSRQMWQPLWPTRMVDQIPIGHITNGVHVDSWLAPEMRELFNRVLGADWPTRLSHADFWRRIYEAEDSELWSLHEVLKVKLIHFVRERLLSQWERWNMTPEELAEIDSILDPNALTIGFARRFATYKRATLIFRDMKRLEALLCDAERPVQIIFAGKAHPNDGGGQALIQQIVRASLRPELRRSIVFIEDYDFNVGRHLVQGVDLWLNNPRRPHEACGTSGQKAVLNGALNLSILDGWWPEAWDGQNGFAIRTDGVPLDDQRQDGRDALALYEVLEREVIPTYFERGSDNVPRAWVSRMKRAIRTLIWKFNADRMVMDYVRNSYLPAAGAGTHEARPPH